MPAEAAVGDVLLFFSVEVGITITRSYGEAEFVGHELANLHVEALAHLGAAGRDLDRAVGVDVDQRIGLVQESRRERDAELHRRDGEAAEAQAIGLDSRLRLPRGVRRSPSCFGERRRRSPARDSW